jgi:hypothetical protein
MTLVLLYKKVVGCGGSDVKLSSGAAVLDTVAAGDDYEPQAKWLKRQGVHLSHRVTLKKLPHVRYQHPDLDEISKFLASTCQILNYQQHIIDPGPSAPFGMEVAKIGDDEIWYKGYGPDQYVYYARKGPEKFLGGTFEVETKEELER